MSRYPEEVACPVCDQPFTKRTANQKICKACRETINLHQREMHKGARYTILERDNFKCVYCGRSPIEDGVKLCIDHVMPYSDEWKDNSLYNLVTSCDECNFSKSTYNLSPLVYARIMKRNIKLNGGISIEMANEVERILTEVYSNHRDGVKPEKPTLEQMREILRKDVCDTKKRIRSKV